LTLANGEDAAAAGDVEPRLAELCAAVASRARALGHHLDPWESPPGEERIARRTVCRVCGRTLYARVEGELMGVAGRASHDPCRR
jgi:hypothetical protein